MKRPRPIKVRPVESKGIMEKKFKRLVETEKHVDHKRVHPVIVISDLRRGNLTSLDRYLIQEGGIPDRGVAVELRKLIAGSRQRSGFRILVIEHPSKHNSRGGRPPNVDAEPTSTEFKVVRDLRILKKEGEVEAAVAEVAEQHNISTSTVYRHLKKVEAHKAKLERERNEKIASDLSEINLRAHREQALANLKKDSNEEAD